MIRWKPNVTVAAVVERDGRFLIVKEHTDLGIGFNQPAGHLERGETLSDAVVRETLEETGWRVTPQALIGVYQAEAAHADITYLRFAFLCHAIEHLPEQPLDQGIIEAQWLSREEINSLGAQLRSPAVMRCLDDYLAGQRYPLEMIHTLG